MAQQNIHGFVASRMPDVLHVRSWASDPGPRNEPITLELEPDVSIHLSIGAAKAIIHALAGALIEVSPVPDALVAAITDEEAPPSCATPPN